MAIIAFGLADMATEHRITVGPAIITAIGLALLADQQNWASDTLIWSLLLGSYRAGIIALAAVGVPMCLIGGYAFWDSPAFATHG